MSKFSLLFYSLLCLLLLRCSKSPQPLDLFTAPDTVSVAFYNVENLFDFYNDGTEYPEYVPNAFNWTRSIQQRKTQLTADVIAALESDIVGLCEIENFRALKQLRDTLKNRGHFFPYIAIATSTSAVTTALLSRFTITEATSHPVPFSSSSRFRSILEADVVIGKDTLKLFINHWPSKFNSESSRVLAASVLRERLSEIAHGTDYIIMGDLNSNYNEHVTFHTEGFNDTEGKTGINHLLRTASTVPGCFTIRYTTKATLLEQECYKSHYNLWLEIPEDERWSYVFRGAGQTLDHFLLPRSLFDSSGISYLDNSFEVFDWNGRLLRDGIPYRWQMHFRGNQRYHSGRGYSDHLPIRARFVRHPFSSDSSQSSFENPVCSLLRIQGEFETGRDGWVSADSRFRVRRDTTDASSGRFSLQIEGFSPDRNVSAAKCRVHRPPAVSLLSLDLKGSGKILFRIRAENSSWIHYVAPQFREAKAPRYFLLNQQLWRRITLPLPRGEEGADIEIEIRAGRDTPFDFRIDRVSLE